MPDKIDNPIVEATKLVHAIRKRIGQMTPEQALIYLMIVQLGAETLSSTIGLSQLNNNLKTPLKPGGG